MIGYEVLSWIGAICWIISAICVAFVGGKYQIKHGFFGSVGIELNKQDRRLVKIAAILFLSGVVFFIIAEIL